MLNNQRRLVDDDVSGEKVRVMITFEPRPEMLRLMGDLADLLEHGELPGEFNMGVVKCGTAACAFGWGATLLPSWAVNGVTIKPYPHDGSDHCIADNTALRLTADEFDAAFQPWLLRHRGLDIAPYNRSKVARIIRWLVERERRRQADEHVRRLNRLAKCAAWGMDREALALRARERRKVAA